MRVVLTQRTILGSMPVLLTVVTVHVGAGGDFVTFLFAVVALNNHFFLVGALFRVVRITNLTVGTTTGRVSVLFAFATLNLHKCLALVFRMSLPVTEATREVLTLFGNMCCGLTDPALLGASGPLV